jgi:type IV pilus assembly protein PilO
MAFEKYRLENLSPGTQLAVVAALGLALSAAIYFVFLQNLLSERGALRADVSRLEASVAHASAFASQLAHHKKELVDLEARLRTLKGILPDQKETPIVLRSVQQMASSSNLKIHKFDPQPVVPKDFYSNWPIAMQIEGSYNAVGEFFEKIGRAPRIINVDNISLKGIDGSTDAARTVSATCTAITFVFREQLAPQPASN